MVAVARLGFEQVCAAILGLKLAPFVSIAYIGEQQ